MRKIMATLVAGIAVAATVATAPVHQSNHAMAGTTGADALAQLRG